MMFDLGTKQRGIHKYVKLITTVNQSVTTFIREVLSFEDLQVFKDGSVALSVFLVFPCHLMTRLSFGVHFRVM